MYNKLQKKILDLSFKLKQAKQVIRRQNRVISELSSPLKLWDDMGAIYVHDKSFLFPSPKNIDVMDEHGEPRDIEISPKDVICIISDNREKKNVSIQKEKKENSKKRKKIIYLRKEYPDNKIKILKYYINKNKSLYFGEINFNSICTYLDSASFYLCKVSNDAIVNIAIYDFKNEDTLELTIDIENCEAIKEIPMSKNKKEGELLKKSFIMNKDRNYSLQMRNQTYENLKKAIAK